MSVKKNLHEALKKYFGFDSFKSNQEAIITHLLAGKDVFVLMPTGGGKSLCYQLPALMMEGTAVVISPLIALMKNQVDAIRHTSENDGVAHFINSSLSKSAIDKVKEDILSGKTKLLYVAPESLTKDDNVSFLQHITISFYAVDEAHCISEWGHDFRPEYRKIRPIIDKIGNAPVIALTATEFKSSFNRPNLYYEIRPKTENIDKDIIKFIRQNPDKSGIIYCLSRKRVEELAEVLRSNNIKAEAYHAGMAPATRSATQDDFLMEKIDVIVATIAFGMGIDKPDVRFVIHYDMPKSLEGYYQETGRAGGDGGEGKCIAFYSRKDLQKLEKFMEGKSVSEQEIGRQLLKETAAYAESSLCRRKLLLHYFGENFQKENCGNCDNCLNPQKKVEAKENLCKVLNTVLATKENFKEDYLKDVLIGRATDEVCAHKHNKIEEFGCGDDVSDKVWYVVIRQAVVAGYLEKDVDNYGVLKVTDKGMDFLENPCSFKIVEDRDYENAEPNIPLQGGEACTVDPLLYQMLKDLRKRMSKDLDVPPYVIFQDASLEAMATIYPHTLDELQNIPGVGAGKAKRYGAEFCRLIKQHCEENDAKGIEFDELLDEIEAIVYSGTKLNIDYFINDVMDDDHIAEIYQYFRDSETDNLETAIEELGDDYTDEEIRLVRIKFISEMAN